MAFRIKLNRPFPDEVRRLTQSQLRKAVAEIKRAPESFETTHAVRKRFKKLRGLLRFARSIMPTVYEFEDAWIRDEGRLISGLRDAEVMLQTFASIRKPLSKKIDRDELHALEAKLKDALESQSSTAELRQLLKRISLDLRDAHQRVKCWSAEKDIGTVVQELKSSNSGLLRTYRKARKAMKRASKSHLDGDLHQWRKHVKYHWHHCQLLRNVEKKSLSQRIQKTKKLADLLGEDHDLAVFQDTLNSEKFEMFSAPIHAAMNVVIQRRRATLQRRAFKIGDKLFQQKPKRFVKKLLSKT